MKTFDKDNDFEMLVVCKHGKLSQVIDMAKGTHIHLTWLRLLFGFRFKRKVVYKDLKEINE